MFSAQLLFYFLFFLATPADVTIVRLPAKGAVALDLTPAGKAEIARAGTLSRVRIEADRVQAPGAAGAGFNTYVGWAVSPEGEFDNLGELAVVEGRIRFEGLTRFDQFGLIVTAEPHYMVDQPSAAVTLRNQPPRDQSVRSSPLKVQVGAYDYSTLQKSSAATFPLASQARTAYEIARAAGADRLAEGELRLARIALDTMEETLNRASPPEIVSPPANEAIRRAHRAFLLAREATAKNDLQTATGQVAALNRDKQQLTARIDELNRQVAAAAERIRRLESDATTAAGQNQQLTQERADMQARIQALQKELQELRSKPAEQPPADK